MGGGQKSLVLNYLFKRKMTRPVLLSENSRSILMTAAGWNPPKKLPQFIGAFVGKLECLII